MSLSLDLPSNDGELEEYIRKLSPSAKKDLAARLDARMKATKQVWFCGDRRCDGEPHGRFPYKHARGSKREDGRGSQYPPLGIDWLVWLMLAGRGAGKSATGSGYSSTIVKKIPSIALIGPTMPAVRRFMIEGDSGLIKACERRGEPGNYEPSKQRFTFHNGAVAELFSAEEPDRLRGGNFGFVWADENAHWADAAYVWKQMLLTLRVGLRPHVFASTTPIPSDYMKELRSKPTTRVVAGSTYDNRSNLSPVYFQTLMDEFEGTYLGRQEIYGEIIDDRQGALWTSLQFQEEDFYFTDEVIPSLDRVLVGIDPAGSNNKRSDETGIIVGGKRGEILHALDDFTGKFSPAGWARASINAYEKYSADAIVVERNYGGDMVRTVLKAEGFDGRIIEAQATESKRVRAEPIAAKYEQHKVRHRRGGMLAKLESEQVSWIPGEGKSPNRLDAWVWVATALTKRGGPMQMPNARGLSTSIGPQPYQGPGSRASRKRAQRGIR
jgi:phage terminase large subunit-like protein